MNIQHSVKLRIIIIIPATSQGIEKSALPRVVSTKDADADFFVQQLLESDCQLGFKLVLVILAYLEQAIVDYLILMK